MSGQDNDRHLVAAFRQGLLDRQTFNRAMLQYRPHVHGRIGDYLVDSGVLARETIERAVAHQHSHSPSGDRTEQPS